jgi:hypothetical protein
MEVWLQAVIAEPHHFVLLVHKLEKRNPFSPTKGKHKQHQPIDEQLHHDL